MSSPSCFHVTTCDRASLECAVVCLVYTVLNPPLPLLRVPRTAQLRCVTGWWFDLVRLKGRGSPHFLLHTRVVGTCDWHGDMLTVHTLSYSLLFVFTMMGCGAMVAMCTCFTHCFRVFIFFIFFVVARKQKCALALTWCHTYLHLARTHPHTHPPTPTRTHTYTHTHTHTTPQSGRRRPVGARSRDQRRQLERRP